MRKEYIKKSKKVVIKVGTRVLTNERGVLDVKQIESLVVQMAHLKEEGIHIIVVTSGAIGAGVGELRLARRPEKLAELQAVAAVGQIRLMHLYHDYFDEKGFRTAQILLSSEDIKTHHENAKNTFQTLLSHNVVPLVNENDSVVVDEIRLGDNDHLSALVTELVDADLLVILSLTDGLLSLDPAKSKEGERLPEIIAITEEITKMAGAGKSELGTGGMKTKLEAARRMVTQGKGVVIANGWQKNVLIDLFQGKDIGTFFVPKSGQV